MLITVAPRSRAKCAGERALPRTWPYSSSAYTQKSAHPVSNALHRRYPDSLLRSGALTAHRMIRLVLLRSRPDTVHGVPLRETRTSTPLFRGGPTKKRPRQDITPAVADCRYRAPLSPRLRGNFLTYVGQDKSPVTLIIIASGRYVKPEKNFPIFLYESIFVLNYFYVNLFLFNV